MDVDAALAAVGLPASTGAERMPGYDATVWRADLPDRTVAVRVLPAGRSPERELAAVTVAGRLGNPVPLVVAHGTADGHAVIVTSWCAGAVLGLDPAGAALLGRAQAALHAPAPAKALAELAGLGAPSLWPDLPQSDEASLLHLDFHPYNVLAADGEVTGIIDWNNAGVGDRRADLARTRAIFAIAWVLEPEVADGMDTYVADWAAAYATVRPMPGDDELAPFLHAAATRMAEDWTPRIADVPVAADVVAAARDMARSFA